MPIADKCRILTHAHQRWLIDQFNNDEHFASIFNVAATKAIPDVHKQFIIYQFAMTKCASEGAFAEFGVYRGGTAYILAKLAGDKPLYLFDTFAGMPATDPKIDQHKQGDFADTSLKAVQIFISTFASEGKNVLYREGFFPDTAKGIYSYFDFVHVDADIYRSVADACEWFYYRMRPGGIILFDDYGTCSCPGAKKAVDEFFATRPEKPILLPTGQCFVVANPENRPLNQRDFEDSLW